MTAGVTTVERVKRMAIIWKKVSVRLVGLQRWRWENQVG